MPYTVTWDETLPLGSTARNQVDDIIRNLKRDLRERYADMFGVGTFTADPLRVTDLSMSGNPAYITQVGANPVAVRINGTEALRLNALRFLKVSNTGTYLGSTAAYHEVSTDQDALGLYVYASHASYQSSVIYVNTVKSAATDFNLINLASATVTRFRVRGNGDTTVGGTLTVTGASTLSSSLAVAGNIAGWTSSGTFAVGAFATFNFAGRAAGHYLVLFSTLVAVAGAGFGRALSVVTWDGTNLDHGLISSSGAMSFSISGTTIRWQNTGSITMDFNFCVNKFI